jgi:hypothetical protein
MMCGQMECPITSDSRFAVSDPFDLRLDQIKETAIKLANQTFGIRILSMVSLS